MLVNDGNFESCDTPINKEKKEKLWEAVLRTSEGRSLKAPDKMPQADPKQARVQVV